VRTHSGEVTALTHEVGDDAVKGASLVMKRLAGLALALLASAQRSKIVCSFGDNIGGQSHFDATDDSSVDGDVEEDDWVAGFEIFGPDGHDDIIYSKSGGFL
jgi:hypothetical protein